VWLAAPESERKEFPRWSERKASETSKRLRDKVHVHPIRVPIILDTLLVVETPYDILIIRPDVSDKVVSEDVEVFLQAGQAQPGRREEVDDVMPLHDIDLSRAGNVSYHKRDRRSLPGV